MGSWRQRALTAVFAVFALGISLLAAGCGGSMQLSHFSLATEKLPQDAAALRVVHISDLHGASFGPHNENLARLIERQEPDLILVSGDMIDSKGDDGGAFIDLLSELQGQYPVYCSLGNHEQIVRGMTGTERYNDFVTRLSDAGAVLLDNERVEFDLGGGTISIYGFTALLSHYSAGDMAGQWEGAELQASFIEERLGPPREGELTILLAHNPKYFTAYAHWGADIVFAGHIHGGVVRLPLLGGVLSPDLTFFPPYDAGIYSLGKTRMHVSRGLGNSVIPFRLFNRPDVSIITIKGQR